MDNSKILIKHGISLIEKYNEIALNHLAKNKSKYKKQDNYEKLIIDFAHVKIEFFKYVFENFGNEVLKEVIESEQIFIAAFFGVGINESVEKYIENNGVFWGHYVFYVKKNEFPSFQLEKYENSIDRFSRKNFGPKSKIISFELVQIIAQAFRTAIYQLGFREDVLQLLLKNIKNNLNQLSKKVAIDYRTAADRLSDLAQKKSYIIVYRGFTFGPKDSVRKGLKLKNNPQAHIQETGWGISFTDTQKVSEMFALARWNSVGNATWEKRIKWNQLLLKASEVDLSNFQQDTKRFAAVGKYKVETKNILINLLYDNEAEIIVLPKDAHLVSYKILKGIKL